MPREAFILAALIYKVHAVKALTKLGLEDCFEGVICFETLNPTHKNTVSGDEDIEFLGSAATATYVHTSPQIFDMMDQFAHHNQGATLPKTPILFSDDSVRNIQAGKHIGSSQRPKGADYALESIHNIKQALPELWEIGTKSVVSYPGQVTVEKSVTA
ncbi:Ribosomal S12 methylthiotransferase RimO [Gossypium arboreum]|uniref:Ribosomal S12 methylthiotransferase RimO n=1 Tax=Gossypium arboreum TaxID=29729 RepID=A0A0B0P5K3_GOSAR|nr:Ribosomal S12 methylthiotransferase RimO [Gossypium arboreum]